jgi:dTDP-4-amino-4,6-dideoxygalactose transaminase
LETYNASTAQVESALTAATSAVMPVHLFGLCCDMEGLCRLASMHGLKVIEDAACAMGATVSGRHAGCWGEAGCFSFHPRKAVTTGEGGLLTTADANLAATARSLRDHGASMTDRERHTSRRPFDLPEFPHVGFNYRMTDIQAALGCGQMRKVDAIICRRRELAARYDEALQGLSWLRTPVVPQGYEHGYQAYVCLVTAEAPEWKNLEANGAFRDRVMIDLTQKGISTRPGTHAVHLQRWWVDRHGLELERFPAATMAHRQSIALPLYPQMERAEQDEVIASLRAA